jgi:two-component system LytT family sensor kinase
MKRRWLTWFLPFGAWTVAGLLFASQWYLTSTVVGPPVSWAYVLTWVVADCYIWAALSPLVLLMGRRFPIESGTWRSAVPLHLGAAAGLSLVHSLAYALATCWTPSAQLPPMTFGHLLFNLTTKKCLTNVVTYSVVLGLGHLFEYHRQFRERELRASQLEGQLSRARLHALEMQLHPHFLFNALNAVSELIHRDPRAADRMVVRLGDMLRATLEGRGAGEVPLRRELELLECYLEVERMRFHDRLDVVFDIDAGSLDAPVPSLILQPLVENAIRHGIASRTGAGRVEIGAGREDGMLVVRVRDDGPGLAEGAPAETGRGVGLSNTRARLEQLYGREARLVLRNVAGGGLEVSLAIPLGVAAGEDDHGEDPRARRRR